MSLLDDCTNYYDVLQVPRDSPHEIIVRQFRALSMRCNPLRNPTNMQVNQMKFDELCEAFEVLSNCKFSFLYYGIVSTYKRKGVANFLVIFCYRGIESHLRQIWRMRPQRGHY